jgi:hypothetical protein
VIGGPRILRVTDSMSGLDQLAAASFELINMEGGPELAALWGQAVARKVSRHAFAEGMTKLEHRAVVKFKAFAEQYALVPADSDGLLRSLLRAPDEYGEFRTWLTRLRDFDPEVYWQDAYDSIEKRGR